MRLVGRNLFIIHVYYFAIKSPLILTLHESLHDLDPDICQTLLYTQICTHSGMTLMNTSVHIEILY